MSLKKQEVSRAGWGQMSQDQFDGERTFHVTERPASLPSKNEIISNALRNSDLKQRPESGVDCIMCATFARKRYANSLNGGQLSWEVRDLNALSLSSDFRTNTPVKSQILALA